MFYLSSPDPTLLVLPCRRWSFMRLQRAYRRGMLELRVPVSLYFHATLFFEDLLSEAAFQQQEFTLQEARQRLKDIVIFGRPATPEIFFVGCHWTFPSNVPGPVTCFCGLMEIIRDSPIFSELPRKTRHFFSGVISPTWAESNQTMAQKILVHVPPIAIVQDQ